jgi:hypothetical protein
MRYIPLVIAGFISFTLAAETTTTGTNAAPLK